MSKFTTVYNRIRAFIPTVTGFTTKTEIPNPYSLEDNNMNLLKDSWGVKVGASSESDSQNFCFNRVKHEFIIEITKELKRLDSDSTIIHAEILELMEDVITLKSAFLTDSQLSIGTSIEIVEHNGTSEVQFIQGEKYNFLNINISFLIEIEEAR